MRLRLPNGRELSYVKPRVDGDDNITYGTMVASAARGRIESYGPKFVENMTFRLPPIPAWPRLCLGLRPPASRSSSMFTTK